MAMSREPNLLPKTKEDNPRCRPYCLEGNVLLLSDDLVEDAWLSMPGALYLRAWC